MEKKRELKVTLINKSDSTGGAAVVTMRLLEALRQAGVDARMLVAEKNTDSEYVEVAAKPLRIKRSFMAERLKIFKALRFKKENLFKIDSASDGLPLASHPLVRHADIICLNWVNQGMLTLPEIEKIHRLGKPIVWTMHDMWPMVGICHYPYECTRFHERCGLCPLLGEAAGVEDLSAKVHTLKRSIYDACDITFVAISRWVAQNARNSSLLRDRRLRTIPNPFPMLSGINTHKGVIKPGEPVTLIMGAARLDVPIKGLPTLIKASEILARDPEHKYRLVTYGGVKDPASFQGLAIEHEHLGYLSDSQAVADAIGKADILVSPAHYETWGATLAEGQVNGAMPVAFNSGGQVDIIEDGVTGVLVDYTADIEEAAKRFAAGVQRAVKLINPATIKAMWNSVYEKFSYQTVAQAYIDLFNELR